MKSRPSILYLFPHEVSDVLADINTGIAPTERLYALVELRRLGFAVNICDSRFQGLFGRLCIFLRRYGLYLLDWNTVVQIYRHDVIVVKDDFSLLITFASKVLGKRIIYLDAMFNLPRRNWRRFLAKISIFASDMVVAYSLTQINAWSQRLHVPVSKFAFFPYALDIDFYRQIASSDVAAPYILAVGRDMGRDFSTLIQAIEGTSLRLKLVTLPYLLPPEATGSSEIDIFERVSYERLFELYAGASMVVVPLKEAIFYPSGIRAVFESALLGKAVIVTRTPVLEEYLVADQEVLYVSPKDVQELRQAILRLTTDHKLRRRLEINAKERVREEYGMSKFASLLAEQVEAVCRRP